MVNGVRAEPRGGGEAQMSLPGIPLRCHRFSASYVLAWHKSQREEWLCF